MNSNDVKSSIAAALETPPPRRAHDLPVVRETLPAREGGMRHEGSHEGPSDASSENVLLGESALLGENAVDEVVRVIRKIGWRDRMGICLSTLCLVHCLLTPFILGFLPVGAAMGIWQHGFHQVFILVVPFVALIAFIPGWKQHRDLRVWKWGAVGIAFLFAGVAVAEMFGHHASGISNSLLGELFLTSIGGGCLIRAHLLNRALCACCEHDHAHH